MDEVELFDFMPKKIMGSEALAEWRKEKFSQPGQKKSWWIRIPKKWWLNDLKKLTPLERCVLIELKLYANRENSCYPAQSTLARDLNLDFKTIRKGISGLKKKRYLKIVKITSRRNSYILNGSSC